MCNEGALTAQNTYSMKIVPNVMVERLTILLRIREVPDSNLGPEIGYPD
jgi:hypothetical protein